VSFLKCFCHECHSPIIPDEYLSLYRLDRLGVEVKFDAVQKASEKIDACWNCGKIHAKVSLLPADNSIVKMHKVSSSEDGDGSRVTSVQMTVEEILKIFDGISDDSVKLLGFNPVYNHPRNMIMTVFPVIPSCSRPFIVADGNICDDDLTNQICEIVKANNALNNETSDIKLQKALQSLKFRIHTFYDNSKGRSKHTTSGRPIKGLKERLTSKEGLFRNNLMGKRVNQSARTVIGPDPSLKMDEVGVPNEICDELTIPEIVSDFNIEKLHPCEFLNIYIYVLNFNLSI
jgi:DNA-directed RNA polymerase beta' subunit